MRAHAEQPKFEGQSRAVRIPIGETHLEGDLNIPPGAQGIVLFAHGSGSSRQSPRNQFVARIIRGFGNATLLFDLLTPAEEMEDRVTAEFRFDIHLLAQRLLAATFWVKNQFETRHLGAGYFGASTGGAAALVAAAELDSHIEAVVSRGGRPDLAGSALARVETPTLLIVGEKDEEVLHLNEGALEKLHCVRELKIIPGATHLFEEEGALEEVANLASEWFNCHLRGRSKGKADIL